MSGRIFGFCHNRLRPGFTRLLDRYVCRNVQAELVYTTDVWALCRQTKRVTGKRVRIAIEAVKKKVHFGFIDPIYLGYCSCSSNPSGCVYHYFVPANVVLSDGRCSL